MKRVRFIQFKSMAEMRRALPTEKKCLTYLEKILWPDGPVSPFDPTSKVYKRGDGTYRCKNTGKNFNVKVGTMFENTKLPLKTWFEAIYFLTIHKKGVSATQLMTSLHVTLKTAWFLEHRIRECYEYNGGKLDGEVELDETFVGGKNKNRHKNKKAHKCQGRAFVDKVLVFGAMQRNGRVVCRVLKNTSWRQLTPAVLRNVKRSVTLYMDEWCGYNKIQKFYTHHVVDHGHGIYVDGGAYTNTIEAFGGNYCKRSINGIYNRISRKHMQRYFNEFSFRYNTKGLTPSETIQEVILNCRHRLTYKQLIAA